MRKVLLALALFPALAGAQTPSEGVALKVRRGFFTETDIGVFFTLGGKNGYSNAQTYLQLGLGYDISENIEIGANFGIGSNAQNCHFEPTNPEGECTTRIEGEEDPVRLPDNFTVTFLDVNVAYLFRIVDRFYVAPKLAGGYTFLDPAPLTDDAGNLVRAAPNFGGGLSIEYATNMDHFSIGADGIVRYIIGPNFPTVAIFGRVKYTF